MATEIHPGGAVFSETFCHVDPLNCVLAVLILIFNTVLILHFLGKCRKLTGQLFVLIALADIASALGHVIPALGEILYFKYERIDIKTFWYVALTYRLFGLLAYTCSIFFNVILSVLRTVRILIPFYQPNLVAMRVTLIGYTCVIISLSVVDLCYFVHSAQFDDVEKFWKNMALPLVEFPFPGDSLLAMNKGLHGHSKMVVKLGCLLFYYILLVTIVLLCMATLISGSGTKTVTMTTAIHLVS